MKKGILLFFIVLSINTSTSGLLTATENTYAFRQENIITPYEDIVQAVEDEIMYPTHMPKSNPLPTATEYRITVTRVGYVILFDAFLVCITRLCLHIYIKAQCKKKGGRDVP